MAEEEKGKLAEKVKMALKILLGIVLIALGLGGIWVWRGAVLQVIRGCIGFILILAGIIFIAIAKE
jgi:hypothetical protein